MNAFHRGGQELPNHNSNNADDREWPVASLRRCQDSDTGAKLVKESEPEMRLRPTWLMDHSMKAPRVEERIHPDNYMFSRHLFAYRVAERFLVENEIAVDVGSGDGYGVRFLAGHGARAIGVDRDSGAVTNADSDPSVRCSFLQADGHAIPLRSGIASLVTSMQVLEHLDRPEEYVAEIRRILRDTGTAVISTPYKDSAAFRFQPEISPYHVQEYEPEGLRALLVPHFRKVRIHGVRFRSGSEAGASDHKLGKIQKVDRLNLRRLVPRAAKPLLYRIFGFKPVSEIPIAVADYEFTDDPAHPEVMDLLAVCRA